MRKEYWQLEAVFNAEHLDDFEYNELFGNNLSAIDIYDLFDNYIHEKFACEFVGYDWKDMNDMAEDYVSFSKKGYVPVDAEGGDFGGDSYEIFWVPRDKLQAIIEFGNALGVNYYEMDIMDIIYNSGHFYPEDLPDDVSKYLGINDED